MQDLPTPFPLPLDQYMDPSGAGVIAILLSRVQQQPINGLATAIFLLAVFHTFVANRFRRAAQRTQLDSELQESALQRQHRVAVVQLYKALGGGWDPVTDTLALPVREGR